MKELLPMIFVLLIVISIPLLIIWLTNAVNRKRAMKAAQRLPAEVLRLLKAPAGYVEITMKDRLHHSLRVIIIGVTIYLIVFVVGIVKIFADDSALDFKTYFLGSLVVLAFIILFVLKDLFKVAPWSEVYRIKAVPCLKISGRVYVCYYDFATVKDEFTVGELPDTSTMLPIKMSKDGTIDILVTAKNNRLKLIDRIK